MSSRDALNNSGLVRPWERGRAFSLRRLVPAPALAEVIDRHWIVRWDLRGRQPFTQEVLPHPSVNLVVEPSGAFVWGVRTHRDVRVLRDRGWAVGTKFKPGAFTATTGREAATITDSRLSVEDALATTLPAPSVDAVDATLDHVVAEIERRLLPLADAVDPSLELIGAVIDSMHRSPPDTRVEALAIKHHMAARTLQRLFRRYVGVGPKWVLKRLRIHRAVEALANARPPDWTSLALDLGYYDHAHFVRDFRLVVGRSPTEYAAEALLARRI